MTNLRCSSSIFPLVMPMCVSEKLLARVHTKKIAPNDSPTKTPPRCVPMWSFIFLISIRLTKQKMNPAEKVSLNTPSLLTKKDSVSLYLWEERVSICRSLQIKDNSHKPSHIPATIAVCSMLQRPQSPGLASFQFSARKTVCSACVSISEALKTKLP